MGAGFIASFVVAPVERVKVSMKRDMASAGFILRQRSGKLCGSREFLRFWMLGLGLRVPLHLFTQSGDFILLEGGPMR